MFIIFGVGLGHLVHRFEQARVPSFPALFFAEYTGQFHATPTTPRSASAWRACEDGDVGGMGAASQAADVHTDGAVPQGRGRLSEEQAVLDDPNGDVSPFFGMCSHAVGARICSNGHLTSGPSPSQSRGGPTEPVVMVLKVETLALVMPASASICAMRASTSGGAAQRSWQIPESFRPPETTAATAWATASAAALSTWLVDGAEDHQDLVLEGRAGHPVWGRPRRDLAVRRRRGERIRLAGRGSPQRGRRRTGASTTRWRPQAACTHPVPVMVHILSPDGAVLEVRTSSTPSATPTVRGPSAAAAPIDSNWVTGSGGSTVVADPMGRRCLFRFDAEPFRRRRGRGRRGRLSASRPVEAPASRREEALSTVPPTDRIRNL